MTTSTRADGPDLDRGFFGQPRPLANLFGVEMWERFSFYGMQGILLIYLYYSVADGGLDIDKATASGIVGADNLRIGFAVPMVLVLGIIPLAPAFAPKIAAAVSAPRPSAS